MRRGRALDGARAPRPDYQIGGNHGKENRQGPQDGAPRRGSASGTETRLGWRRHEQVLHGLQRQDRGSQGTGRPCRHHRLRGQVLRLRHSQG